MPRNEREVWDYFSGEENQESNLLSFASYAFDKFEWIARFEELQGREPSPDEVDNWISQLPESRLGEMREWAENFFDTAARAYLEDEHKAALRDAVDGAIVSDVRDSNRDIRDAVRESNNGVSQTIRNALSFQSTFLPNVFIGIVSSLLFSVLLVIASIIFARDPSPLALAKRIPGVAPDASAAKPVGKVGVQPAG